MVKYTNVIGLNINLISYQNAMLGIIDLAKQRANAYVCFANVHMTIEAYQDRTFKEQVNKASLVLPDGMPLVKTLKIFYGQRQERIAGMDAMPDLIKLAELNGCKIFFFGSTLDVLERIKVRAMHEFPKIQIVGAYSPPFEKSLDDDSYIDMINSSEANLVFVALGCPKQEKWMANHHLKINAVLLGVGGAFPIYAQTAKRAPVFMQNISLEWLYRLCQEPGRLFWRYFRTNILFIYLVFKIKLKLIFLK